MALRIRQDGTILCAAMHPEMPNDTYIPDHVHYQMSVIEKCIVTEPHEQHSIHGQWWWRNQIPDNVTIESFYLEA